MVKFITYGWPEKPTSGPPPRRRKVSADSDIRARRPSTDVHENRPRKTSTDIPRTRKVSTDGKEAGRRVRDSAPEEGYDEGYDDLLSAYESEENSPSYVD